jgi:nitroreductase
MEMQTAEVTVDFLRRLRAVRHFRPDPVSPAVVDDLLAVARWTGSARNRQPWEFVVVREPATLQALSALEGSVGHLASAPLAIVLVMAGQEPEQEIYDEGRLSERIMLAAAAHDLGSCIGWFRDSGVVAAKALLGVPEGRRLRTVLSIGHVDALARAARQRPGEARKPLADLVHLERYGGSRQ